MKTTILDYNSAAEMVANRKPRTKKEFLSRCRVHKYTAPGIYVNAVFYDWTTTENTRGFKWVIFARDMPKRILLNYAYKIAILGERSYPWTVNVKNDKLYKVPLSFGWL